LRDLAARVAGLFVLFFELFAGVVAVLLAIVYFSAGRFSKQMAGERIGSGPRTDCPFARGLDLKAHLPR
jgi:hypothetical protein